MKKSVEGITGTLAVFCLYSAAALLLCSACGFVSSLSDDEYISTEDAWRLKVENPITTYKVEDYFRIEDCTVIKKSIVNGREVVVDNAQCTFVLDDDRNAIVMSPTTAIQFHFYGRTKITVEFQGLTASYWANVYPTGYVDGGGGGTGGGGSGGGGITVKWPDDP